MRDILQMGDANCMISLDVGDRDVQGNVIMMDPLVEVGPEVEAIINTTSLRIPLQTKRGEEWVTAVVCRTYFGTSLSTPPAH
jgi:hypothetical protein